MLQNGWENRKKGKLYSSRQILNQAVICLNISSLDVFYRLPLLSLFRLLVFLFFFPIFSQPIFLLHTIVPFRHPATLLARRWQVGLIIVQVFFKERITRSMFTASFSFSSCLLYLRHFFFCSFLFIAVAFSDAFEEWKRQ